jgi:hypothetical protein
VDVVLEQVDVVGHEKPLDGGDIPQAWNETLYQGSKSLRESRGEL